MLHYGSDYLEACIKSLDDVSEKIVILYAKDPTHNPSRGLQCPDSRDELRAIAHASSNKIEWVNIVAGDEGKHREMAFKYASGFDLMLTLDSDEVWSIPERDKCIEIAQNTDSRYIGVVGFLNFWKSFHHVLRDGFAPVRIHNLKSQNLKQQNIDGKIYHFGYAIPRNVMQYKISIHGHRSEWRGDWFKLWDEWDGTLNGRWHPVSYQIWHDIEIFDKRELPENLQKHKWFHDERIS